MKKNAQLDFTIRLLNELRTQTYTTAWPPREDFLRDLGLRKEILSSDIPLTDTIQLPDENFMQSRSICLIEDLFRCSYLFIPSPDPSPLVLVAGPFRLFPNNRSEISALCQELALPSGHMIYLTQYYESLPYLGTVSLMEGYLKTLGQTVFGNAFKLLSLPRPLLKPIASFDTQEPVSLHAYDELEERYHRENAAMQAIARGDSETAESLLYDRPFVHLTQRVSSTLRDRKNYAIVGNTLMRKAAETGHVHPIYLDSTSSRFAVRIEQCSSLRELEDLQHTMIRQYALLVRSHSTEKYSRNIRAAVDYIHLHVSGELSLAILANHLSLSKPYLSAQFRKETGQTVTDYIAETRINAAINLLNTSDDPLQAIASACGVPDLTYFGKLFKKSRGLSPSEYRRQIKNTKANA